MNDTHMLIRIFGPDLTRLREVAENAKITLESTDGVELVVVMSKANANERFPEGELVSDPGR